MAHKRKWFAWCPQPQTPIFGVLRQYSKPIIALISVSIIAASFIAASSFFAFSQSVATAPLIIDNLPETSATPTGATGTPGDTGSQSPKGDTGATGAIGMQGSYLPDYFDSGWVDITGKQGQKIIIPHNLNSNDVTVEITGKQTANGSEHQTYLGLGPNGTQEWTKWYGGTGFDFADSAIQTSDGGYAIAGYTNGPADHDSYMLLIKTFPNGTQQWAKCYGTGSDDGSSVVQTSDGGFAIAGSSNSVGTAGGDDVFLVKTSANGTQEWAKYYGGINDDYGDCIIQTSDGGFAIAGTSYSANPAGTSNLNGTKCEDVFLVKTSPNGTQEWAQYYGGTDADCGYCVVQTSEGGYVITGQSLSNGTTGGVDFILVKTYANGTQEWIKWYGGIGSQYGYCVVQTSDAGYAISGKSGEDMFLVKTSANGTQEWAKKYGETDNDCGYSLIQTFDGGFAIAGFSYLGGTSGRDVLLVKTSADGTQQWTKCYGGTGDDCGYCVVQTSDGGFAIAGTSTSKGTAGSMDVFLVKTEPEQGLARVDSSANTIVLYRGISDTYWNYVRVRIWKK